MNYRKLTFSALLIGSLFMLAGCEEQGPMEEAGEEMDNMADEMGDSMDRAGNQVEDACESIKDGMNAENQNC